MSDKFAKALALLRAQRGLTQRELAAKVGIAWSMISKYESGQSKPRLKTLLKLADALYVPVDRLNGDDPVDTYQLELTPEQHERLEGFAMSRNLPLEDALAYLVAKMAERTAAELDGKEPAWLTKGFPGEKDLSDVEQEK